MSATKRLFLLAALAAASLATHAAPAIAWGTAGHSVVAEIAQRRLPPKARQKLAELIGPGVSLASISSWADTQAALKPETRRWHFVNIPADATGYDRARDCAGGTPPGCIVEALSQQMASAATGSRARAERAAAIRYIVHLVADMHQPLHCSDKGDQGGNSVQVRYFGQPTTLHLLWDFGILDKESFDWGVHLAESEAELQRMPAGRFGAVDLRAWVDECHKLALVAYQMSEGAGNLGATYRQQSLPVVYRQLAAAGARLAHVLAHVLR